MVHRRFLRSQHELNKVGKGSATFFKASSHWMLILSLFLSTPEQGALHGSSLLHNGIMLSSFRQRSCCVRICILHLETFGGVYHQ
jgi:hypothetical protein